MKKIRLPFLIPLIFLSFIPSMFCQGNAKEYTLADTSYAESLLTLSDSLVKTRNLSEALIQATKAKDIYSKTQGSNHYNVGLAWEQIGKITFYNQETKLALKYYETAFEIYLKANGENHFKVGESYNNLGVLNSSLGNFNKSLEFQKKSIAFKERLYPNDLKSLIGTYNNTATAYQYLSKVDSALLFNQKSTSAIKKVYGENSYEMATNLMNIGSCYGQLGDFNKQLEYTIPALKQYKTLVDETDRYRILATSNLADAYKGLGEYHKAEPYYQQCLDIKKKISKEKSLGLSIAYNNLATNAIQLAKYKRAKSLIKLAFQSFPDDLSKSHPHLAHFNSNLARCFSELGDPEKAIDFYEKGLNILIKNYGKNNATLSYPYNNMALYYFGNEDYKTSIDFYEKAIDAHLSNFDEVHPNMITFYEGIGSSYVFSKNFNKAEEYLNKALNIKKKLYDESHRSFGATHFYLGRLSFHKGNYPKATQHYQEALKRNKTDLEYSTQIDINYSYALANSLHKEEKYKAAESIYLDALKIANYTEANQFNSITYLGKLIPLLQSMGFFYQEKFKTQGRSSDLEKSTDYFQQSIRALAFQSNSISPDSKKSNVKWSKSIFEGAITTTFLQLQYKKGNHFLKEELFKQAERSKATILLDAFQDNNALRVSGIPDSLLSLEYNLRLESAILRKIKEAKKQSIEFENDTTFLNLSNQIADLDLKSEALKKQFENDYPKYFKAKYDLSSIPLNDVQKNLLQANQSLIEYVIGDSNSYILLVNPDTFLVHEIIMDFPLKEWVESFRVGLTKYHTTTGNPKSMLSKMTQQYVRQGQQLHQKLIEPIATLLNKEIIIIPDGVLGYLPFEILLSKKPNKLTAFHKYPYLLKKHNISYCYSATLLQEMIQRQHPKPAKKNALTIAPFFKGDIKSIIEKLDTMDFLALRNDTLQALPFSGDEAAIVAKITKGDQWLGGEASIDRFTQKAPNYRILHLSTHGVADDKVGDYAYLAFGNTANKDKYEKLFIQDIYNIPLNADMVVLSACKTAYGKLQKGEGIISMARAFAYAGAKSIITSHWSVDDKSTGIIMENFYKNLAKGDTKHKALQGAKLNYIKNNKGLKAHPFFWAAFVGIGDMSKMQN